MANAILTSPIDGEIAQNTEPFDFTTMPAQALVAILTAGQYDLSYNAAFTRRAPSLSSAIVAATKLQFSSKAVQNLLSSVTVDLNVATATTLFTCPAGVHAIIYRVVLRGASTSLTLASISFGWNAVAFNDVIADATHTELTGPTLDSALLPKAGAAVGNPAGVFKVIPNTQQGAAATVIVDTFGYLV